MSNNTRDLISNELDSFTSKSSIFVNESILSFDYLPLSLPHREEQILELTRNFNRVFEVPGGFRKIVSIIGPLGTGKSSSAKRFGRDLMNISKRKKPAFSLIYKHFNCRTHKSPNFLLSEILNDLLPIYPKRGFSFGELIRDLFIILEKKNLHLVLTLDEVDYLFADSNINNLLFAFIDEKNEGHSDFNIRISLILITKNNDFFFLLEPSIRSRLTKNIIKFPAYTASELSDILYERAQNALVKDSFSSKIINAVSNFAQEKGGDARVAIELLWRSAKIAETSGRLVIEPKDLRKSISSINPLEIHVLQDLTKNELYVFLAVAKTLERHSSLYHVDFSSVKTQYTEECARRGYAITENNQNIWPFLKRLVDYGLVRVIIVDFENNSELKDSKDYKLDQTHKITLCSIDLPLNQLILELDAKIN